MKYFVTGVNGQLGHDVMEELVKRDNIGIGSDITPEYAGAELSLEADAMEYVCMDITDASEVDRIIGKEAPDVVIHCAAWTAVDDAEEESNKKKVYEINVKGTENIVRTCQKIDCKMIYLSTDYVFNGEGTKPWKPDSDAFNPLNYYGKTKLLGEKAVSSKLKKYFIVRIAWVFGLSGNNFVKTMLKVGKTHDTLTVVNDQIGTPTYTLDLARLLIDMSESNKYGYYHATNEGGYISWYDFACEIFSQAKYETRVIPVTTEEYGVSKAKRPGNSRLDRGKISEAGFALLPHWRDALARYLLEVKNMEL